MSAKKIDGINGDSFSSQPPQNQVTLSASTVRVHRNGLEFHTENPMTVWKEIAIAIESPLTVKKIQCSGVIVACTGNRHSGYSVSMVFTQISKHSQELLSFLSSSRLN